MATAGAISAAGIITSSLAGTLPAMATAPNASKAPARVLVAFLYPPAHVVEAGEMEDGWARHNWFTWPGNQFMPEEQEKKFTHEIHRIAEKLDIDVEFMPTAIYQSEKVDAFISKAQAEKPDAVLIVNFWNSLSPWSYRMVKEAAPTGIVYQPVGSNHQLPPEYLRKSDGFYYIHSIENWEEIERGLRAVRTKKMLSQSRLLRVSGAEPVHEQEAKLGVDLVGAPADEFNAIFDAVQPDEALIREAMRYKEEAFHVTGVNDEYIIDAFRAHQAVGQIIERYEADAITIECLMLKHRKPCISFAINNGNLIPNGCENDLNGTLTQMLGRWLFDRPGFMHNPEFDTSNNHYFASHCTCATKLHGPEGPEQEYMVRPFFHQLPNTAALDVQWTPDEPVVLAKYHSGQDAVSCWTGKVIESPASPPTGGCATRVLVAVDKVDDVCDIYPGPHPILFCAKPGLARSMNAFARMYNMELIGNV